MSFFLFDKPVRAGLYFIAIVRRINPIAFILQSRSLRFTILVATFRDSWNKLWVAFILFKPDDANMSSVSVIWHFI